MFASVYRLRERGMRMPRPSEPVRGDVVLLEEIHAEVPELTARVVDGGSDLLPPLRSAKVTRISRNGLVIQGIEITSRVPGSIKANRSSHRQTWWAAVWTEDMLNAYDGDDPLDAIADDFSRLGQPGLKA